MNRKQYLASIIILGVVTAGLVVTNTIYAFMDWLYVFIIVSAGYLFIKYKVSGPLQMFATKFSMLVDYDLDVEGAVKMCEQAIADAPTRSIEALYRVYGGMALYYAGRYQDAVKMLNAVELKRLNSVYHVLIFAFVCYASYEDGDLETFNFTLERIKNLKDKVGPKYQGFVDNYIEILSAIQNIDVSVDHYKEVVEKHFTREDGFISTKLIFNYRMAIYYQKIGDTLEMDKCLAFVIANGKEHHTAISARSMFKGSVDVKDYIYVEPQTKSSIDLPVEADQPELIETQSGKPEEEKKDE